MSNMKRNGSIEIFLLSLITPPSVYFLPTDTNDMDKAVCEEERIVQDL